MSVSASTSEATSLLNAFAHRDANANDDEPDERDEQRRDAVRHRSRARGGRDAAPGDVRGARGGHRGADAVAWTESARGVFSLWRRVRRRERVRGVAAGVCKRSVRNGSGGRHGRETTTDGRVMKYTLGWIEVAAHAVVWIQR